MYKVIKTVKCSSPVVVKRRLRSLNINLIGANYLKSIPLFSPINKIKEMLQQISPFTFQQISMFQQISPYTFQQISMFQQISPFTFHQISMFQQISPFTLIDKLFSRCLYQHCIHESVGGRLKRH